MPGSGLRWSMGELCGLDRVVLTLLGVSFLSFVSAGCGGESAEDEAALPARASGPPTVLVTVAPQAQIVEWIAGDLVQVEVLVPPDADPHTFEPTIDQMRAVSRASLYFLVGHPALEFEMIWRQKLAAQGAQIRFVDGSEGLDLIPDDPHVWLSPRASRVLAQNLARGLEEMLPNETERIEEGLSRFLAEVETLDSEIRGMLAGRPTRAFLVYHAAWGWFADDYGLEQIAIERGHVHPGPAHVAALMDRARRDEIRVVFVQPQVGGSQAAAFAKEIDGRVVRVDPLAPDWFGNLRTAARAFAESGGSGAGR